MTLEQAIAQVRMMMNVSQTTGAYSDANIAMHINLSQSTVWDRIAGMAPDRIMLEETITSPSYTVDRLNYRAAGLFTQVPLKILAVFVNDGGGTGLSERRFRLQYIQPKDLPPITSGVGYPYVDDISNNSGAFWTLINKYLILRPVPPSSYPLIIQYIPRIDDLSDGDDVLNGEWPEFERLVTVRAANSLAESTRAPIPGLKETEGILWDMTENTLRSTDEPLIPRDTF